MGLSFQTVPAHRGGAEDRSAKRMSCAEGSGEAQAAIDEADQAGSAAGEVAAEMGAAQRHPLAAARLVLSGGPGRGTRPCGQCSPPLS